LFHFIKTQDLIDVHLITVPPPGRKDKANQLIAYFGFGSKDESLYD